MRRPQRQPAFSFLKHRLASWRMDALDDLSDEIFLVRSEPPGGFEVVPKEPKSTK